MQKKSMCCLFRPEVKVLSKRAVNLAVRNVEIRSNVRSESECKIRCLVSREYHTLCTYGILATTVKGYLT